MVHGLELHFFLSISGLPCMLQLKKAMCTQWKALLKEELILTLEIMLG